MVGSIMPAIMAAHIAHNSTSRGASHVTVIIHADAPVIGPYMSRAMATTHAQQASGRMTMRTMSVRDGRPSAASMAVFTEGAIVGRNRPISYDRIVLLSRP